MVQTEPVQARQDVFPPDIDLGIGAWAWGDRIMWDYGRGYGDDDIRTAFEASIDGGVRFFDTAEFYGFGQSERLLGRFMRDFDVRPYIATKFMPVPWRFLRRQLVSALRGSLRRLGMEQVDLYQIHFPSPPRAVETWAEALADALDLGLTAAVGVSNYSAGQTRRTHDTLARRGYALASNQVEYSLIQRSIEFDGTMQVCNELGVKIIAYSPLGMGLLTGKYTPDNPPPGVRGLRYRATLARIQPLVALLREIGDRRGKTPAQVATNWTICKGTVPIPGAKNARQARDNAGAAGWRLTPDEVTALDEASLRATR